jgi:hypothetical protein
LSWRRCGNCFTLNDDRHPDLSGINTGIHFHNKGDTSMAFLPHR